MASEHDVSVFLVALALLLFAARVLGELARRIGLPSVAGELSAGVLLGPTVLGRVAPGSMEALFPPGKPAAMLSGYTLLASVLLLTLAGLEIDLSVVLRRRREAALTSFLGVAFPMTLGFVLGLALPASYLVDPGQRLLFAVFVGTALSISAMPVIAKTLLDLGFFRTDLGLVVMASAMVDDLAGWLLFSLLVGPMHGQSMSLGALGLRAGLVLVFVAVVLGLGRPLADRLLSVLDRERMQAPGRVLSAIIVLAVLGAAAAQAIGVHAVFGAFVVSVAVGDSPRLRSETRASIHELVSSLFAPVFFAAVGLRVDFVAHFEPLLVLAVVVVACVAKVLGCALGARLGGMAPRDAWAVGFAMNSRGAMEIILALVALEAGLIGQPLFVALVTMALVTSLLSGPVMARLLRGRRADVRALIEEGAVLPTLRARTAEQAVREIVSSLAAGTPLDGPALADAALEDAGAGAGLADGVALTSARLAGVARPMVGLGLSDQGIDFDATDGEDAHIVFVLLIPTTQRDRAVELQAGLVRLVATGEQRAALRSATSRAELLAALDAAAPSSR